MKKRLFAITVPALTAALAAGQSRHPEDTLMLDASAARLAEDR